MTVYLIIVAAVLAALGVVVAEVSDRTFARRKANAGRSRMPAPEQKAKLRI
jgi:hypothetical protein